MGWRNGLHDPPPQGVIFGSDPYPVPPLYTYEPIFPGGDPTGIPPPPPGRGFQLPPPPAGWNTAPVPVPGKTAGSGGMLLLGGAVLAVVLLMKGKR
jgi:hypothetical protein